MRTIHKARKSRFLSLRPTYPYLSDFSTASCAARCSLLLVRKKPFARASVFLRLLRRLVPRLTLGTFLSPSVIQRADQARACALSTPGTSATSFLVRNHPPQLGLIRLIGHDTFSQAAFPRARLRGQNVTGKSMVANHFAGSRFLEPLGRTLMGLQLWHKYPMRLTQ